MNKNAYKSDAELAWEFVRAEMERQYYEPQAILVRLAGTQECEVSTSKS